MKVRAIKDYLAADGKTEVREWLDSLLTRARAKIQARIVVLESMKVLQRPYVGILAGDCDGLLEIRVNSGNVEYRPLACYGPGGRQVTILYGTLEKNRKFVPPDACRNALTRRQVIQTIDGRTCEHDPR